MPRPSLSLIDFPCMVVVTGRLSPTIKNDNHNPLTLAEMEACQQFEQSQRAGEAMFRPQVAAGRPAPNCVVFLEEVGRFCITALGGRYTVEDGDWYHHEADGTRTEIDGDPLEAVWKASSVRTALEPELGFQPYAIAVAWFPDMEEDEAIVNAAKRRGVKPLFGQTELPQRLVRLPKDAELQTQLSRRYIKQEMAALSRSSAAASPEASENASPAVKGRVGALDPGTGGDRQQLRHHRRW